MCGGSYVAAGVASQYLQLHPAAGPEEVRAALVAMATPHTVTAGYWPPHSGSADLEPGALGGIPRCTTRMLFTNLTEPSGAWEPAPEGEPAGHGGDAGGGGVPLAAVIVPIVAGESFPWSLPWM